MVLRNSGRVGSCRFLKPLYSGIGYRGFLFWHPNHTTRPSLSSPHHTPPYHTPLPIITTSRHHTHITYAPTCPTTRIHIAYTPHATTYATAYISPYPHILIHIPIHTHPTYHHALCNRKSSLCGCASFFLCRFLWRIYFCTVCFHAAAFTCGVLLHYSPGLVSNWNIRERRAVAVRLFVIY